MYTAATAELQEADRPFERAGEPVAPSLAKSPAPRAGEEGQREEPVLTDALIKLLRSAGRQLRENSPEAGSCINRALSLLEAERQRRECDLRPPSPTSGGLTPWRARRVRQHIEENLDTIIRIEDLAGVAKLSVRHFSLAFKQSFGQSPHAHIVGRRIEKARELMLLTDEPLSRVAVACGLADQAHLSKWFRRLVGVTPNAWRRQYRA